PLPDMLNDYLELGKDLATNIFTAVSNSIKQSTLSGYASLGQVMRNAVNAALFSLADTLKEPLYRSLLSQTRSMLPWFLKFIPRTFQLLPIFKPLLPVFGGLALGLGNSIVKNLMGNDVLKPGGFLTKLLSSITRIDLTSLSGQGTHGVMGLIAKMMNPVPGAISAAGAGGFLGSLGLGLFGPFMNTFSGILGLDPSTRSNPKNQAPTVERVLQEQIKSNRKKAGLSDAKGSQASRELIENIGNKTVDSVLENLNIPMIPTSVIQGMTGNKIKQQSGEIANAISSIGVQRSKAEQLLEKTIKSGRKDVATRADILTRQVLRERGYSTSVRNAMSSEVLEKARRYISNTPLAASDNERKLMQAMGDIEESRVRLGDVKANRELDRLTAKVLLERGGTLKDYRNVKKSGELDILRANLLNSVNTTGVVGRLTQAYASNDQEALKSLLLQGLRKAGMSSEQVQNIDPKILNTATAGLMATLTGLQAKFKEKGFDMGKALTQGFKDSVRNLANAKDDLEYNAKKAIGKANFGDAVGLIFRRMTRGTVATQDQFKEMYNQMGAGLKKTLFSSPKQADEMFPNVLQFMGSIAATLAPVTTLFASLTPLFLPLAPIIGGIGAAVNMVAPHVAKLIDGIQRVEVLQRRFTFLGGSKAGGEAEFKYAKDIAAKMNVPSEVAANSYSQLAIAARDSKMEGQGVKDLFEGITASLSALGISGQDASLVFMAYTQILAKGKLSMEELRQQLGEKFPPAMGVFAKAMGVSVPEMNALVQSGSVLSQDILPKVAKVLKQDYGNAAANQAGGLVVALNKLGNVGFEITTIFTDKLGGTLGWFVSTFADGLSLLSSTLGTLIPLGQSFAIGFAATIAIGLTTIMKNAAPLVVLLGSLQNLLMATFSVITTNMMPMIVGVTADVADNWLGAEKDLIKNMMDGITNAVLATFSTIDSAMRSMSDGNLSFSSMFGGLVQGAEQAGNIIDWLKGIFKGFFSIIPPGFVELLAMVFMFEQGTGLAVMALLPALKGFMGAFTGMVSSTAKAFMGFMTSMKVATELMMTSMSSAMAASEARIKIFSATMGFLRTALTHVAVAFGILMFSKGDFSNPMGDSLSKATKELNNGLTEIRANVQKTADSFDKATNSVSKLGGTLADALPSKGVQLDIRSFWGGGDFKWDDAIKERNKRKSSSGSYMDALGLFGLGVAGAGSGAAVGAAVGKSILGYATSTAATIAANAVLAAGPAAPVSIFGKLAMTVAPLITAITSPLGLAVVAVAGFAAAVTAAVVALDLFAPKLTESQKGLIERNKLGNYFDVNDSNARLTNAQQQILKYFEDQEKNIRNLKEFSASQGLTGKSTDFVATIKPLTAEQQDRFNSTPEIAKLNEAIKENNDRRLAIIADKISNGASPQEIKELKNSSGFKNLENKSKEMRNAVALASATFQISDTSENQKATKDLDEKIRNKQAEIDKRRAAITRARNLTAAYATDGFAMSIGDGSDLGTKQLEDDLNALKEQKKNQEKIIKASVQRAFSFEEIKEINKKLAAATKKSVELDKALPSDKVRTEQGAIKLVIQQLYKQRQELVDSFSSPLPILEKQLRLAEEYKQKLRMGEVEGVQIGMIPQAVQATQRKIDLLKKRIAALKPFNVQPFEEALYTQAINAINDVTAKFERNSSINRVKSSLSQAKVYSRTGTSQQIAPDLANIQLADLGNQGKLLEEKVKTGQAALDKISQAIAMGGTNLDEARAKYKEVLENLTKDREALAQNTLEIAKVQREVRQALIDQTKQVADYYRT
ncbi:MAG: tape measure protein, partial [Candidatus Nanopelagicaceae bacterium]